MHNIQLIDHCIVYPLPDTPFGVSEFEWTLVIQVFLPNKIVVDTSSAHIVLTEMLTS